ncbi:hypothetical protein [Nocardioides donggukensis]|uniref:Septum formation-related domain-containing protein n=1 Tax=Nocardioides donggukensis TaxID=2774019 RepID=A0A927PYU1_9ACTN|nr:hypothetical protein [Nocardioides donggukensis]MBD8868933.1 hypothetical protein [Nocardioides donggukensis]
MSNQPPTSPSPYGEPVAVAPTGPPAPPPNPFAEADRHPDGTDEETRGTDEEPDAPAPAPAPHPQPLWRGHEAPQQVPGRPSVAEPSTSGTPRRRRWWLLPLVLVVLVVAVVAVLALWLLDGDGDEGTAISDLAAGECLVSTDIAAANGVVERIDVVGCTEPHDAEVFATYPVATSGEVDLEAAGATCVDELAASGASLQELTDDGREVRPLVAGDTDAERVVCFVRNSDGSQLSGPVVG